MVTRVFMPVLIQERPVGGKRVLNPLNIIPDAEALPRAPQMRQTYVSVELRCAAAMRGCR